MKAPHSPASPRANRLAFARPGAWLAFLPALILPLADAQAGFFDFLFPPPPPAAPAYSPPSSFVPHKKVARKPKPVVAVRPHVPARVVASVMDDDSLRVGDAVMTDAGVRIYVGARDAALPHSPGDFAPLAAVRKLPARSREALLAMDERRVSGALVTGRSAADPDLAYGHMIVDPRGVKIRYVGP